MDHHIAENPARNFDICDRRWSGVKRGDRQQFRLANLACRERLFERAKIGVKAAVEPDHHREARGIDDILAGARALKA